MAEWIIVYQKKGADDDCIVVMPSITKLLSWIVKHASKCSTVSIRLVEG